MSLQQIDLYLENKLKQNKNYIVFTYYELRVKLNLSSEESLNFLHLVSTKLQNNNTISFTPLLSFERFIPFGSEAINLSRRC